MGMPRVLSKTDDLRNTAQLGAFAVYLWKYGMNRRQVGNTYSTIVGKLSAIRWFHRKLGYNPGVSTGHGQLMAGIKRMTDPVAKKHPLTPAMLRTLRKQLNLGDPKLQLLWGGLVMGYFFLLRRSEYLKVGGKWFGYVLILGNITFYNSNNETCPAGVATMVGITLMGAKNNQYGRNEVRV